jgi:hypothetical protein
MAAIVPVAAILLVAMLAKTVAAIQLYAAH